MLLFAKKFQVMPLREFADLAAEMGFDGIDLTVRPNGYIRPEDVSKRLPEAVDIFKDKGLSVPMITTAITNAREPYAEETFRVAAECGIRYIKLGYWEYRGFGHLKHQINELREALKGIQELSKRHRITAVIHTHSGPFLTAEPTILWLILRDFNPDLIGAYVDPGHMVVEGGLSGWIMGMDILSDKIRVVAVKDFAWFKEENSWKARVVPLGEGLVPWRDVFGILKRMKFDGPISLHSEYRRSLNEIIEQTKKDLRYVKDILASLS